MKPTHQLSRMSLLVPVFTAAQCRDASGFSSPKVTLLASASESMLATIHEAAGSSTWVDAVFSALSSFNGDHCPPLAMAR